MFSKILIANRGEIACRVIRTARRMGIATVAVYSAADRAALHVAAADEAWPIGPAEPRESYLNIAAVLAAAKASGAEAVHPGYGFLSENADFAEACANAGLVFIGPPAAAIRAMGSKSAAKALMAQAGVPLVPGYHGADQDPDHLLREAKQIGFPVLIKASAGGGGRGMRIVKSAGEFAEALAGARREALAAFGDDNMLIEKYLERARHIEIQVFADRHGNVVHLGERDCSVQRRHQKVVEEAPAPGLAACDRQKIGEAAVAAARAVGYEGAGTAEFVAASGKFFFIEMNTRLQVEHPVTECVTGLDLVEWQLRIAAGENLALPQGEIAFGGHAIEVRLYAEDPRRGFLPQTGTLYGLRLPAADLARVDSGVREGDRVEPYYDPMIAKIIAFGEDRAAALGRLRRALAATAVLGVTTNLSFLARIAADPEFAAGPVDTGFIERRHAELLPPLRPAPDAALAAAALARLAARQDAARSAARLSGDRFSPWACGDAWRPGADPAAQQIRFRDSGEDRVVAATHGGEGWRLRIDGRELSAAGKPESDGAMSLVLDGVRRHMTVLMHEVETAVFADGEAWRLDEVDPLAARAGEDPASGRLAAPMPGRVVRVLVAEGAAVTRGQPLVVIEAMKMEHTVTAPTDGVVERVRYAEGERVEEGAELIVLARPDERG